MCEDSLSIEHMQLMPSESEINPYESPRETAIALAHSSKLNLIFFLINFFCSIIFIFLGAAAIVDSLSGSFSPFGLLGGPFFIVPATMFAIGEWQLFARKREGLRRPLGVVCGAISAFWAFALAANVWEALVAREIPEAKNDTPDMILFWLIFGSICITISLYNAFCCWNRFRYRRQPPSRASGDIL